MIYLLDHLPPHVHVFVADGEVVINLNCRNEELGIREVYGLKVREVRKALEIVKIYRDLLCKMWREIHGDF